MSSRSTISSGGFADNVPEGARFAEASVTDSTARSRKLFDDEQFDYVYHLAAYAAEGLSHFIRRFNYTDNVLGSINLINESVRHEVECFVFTSSIAVYGAVVPPPNDRGSATLHPSPYGVAEAGG